MGKKKRGGIPRSSQGSLFAGARVQKLEEEQSSPEKRPTRVKFIDRSPEGIFISDQPLRSVLEGQGEVGVIRLREFLRGQDWSGFEASYAGGGRPAYHPAVVVGLVLWGMLQGMDSLRGLERLAQQNIACWWLTGGACPDHSQVGRFLQRHREVLSQAFFEELTARVLGLLGGGGQRLAGDGTVMQAAASAYGRIREEAAREALDQAGDEKEKEKAREVLDQLAQRQASKRRNRNPQSPHLATVSPTEPEAVIQPIQGTRLVPAYKGNVLSDDRQLIVAAQVEPSSEADALRKMLQQSRRVSGVGAQELLLDGNYFKGPVFSACQQGGVQLWCPPPTPPAGSVYAKRDFEYQEDRDAYRCPQGQWLHRMSRGRSRGQPIVVYGGAPCEDCLVRKQCTRSATGRQIARYEDEAFREEVRQRMRTPEGQAYYRKRKAWVEPVFAALKTRHRFGRFRRRGLAQVRLEWALQASAYNLGRWLRLASWPPSWRPGTWKGLLARLSGRLDAPWALLRF